MVQTYRASGPVDSGTILRRVLVVGITFLIVGVIIGVVAIILIIPVVSIAIFTTAIFSMAAIFAFMLITSPATMYHAAV